MTVFEQDYKLINALVGEKRGCENLCQKGYLECMQKFHWKKSVRSRPLGTSFCEKSKEPMQNCVYSIGGA